MKLPMMIILVFATFALVQGQGLYRLGHRGHSFGLPSQSFISNPDPYVPFIPAPSGDIWGWMGDNFFGRPLFPGRMIQGQMSPNGLFWDQQPGFRGQIGQWPMSGLFRQNGQQWLSNDQSGWNNPLSANTMNSLNGEWSGQLHNLGPMTDDQYDNGRVPNANTGNSDTWARYTQFTDGNRIVGNQLLGNQQFDVKSGVSVGLTQNGFDSMDGSLTKNGFQAGHSQFNSGFPVLAGGINGAQTGNIPTRIAGNNNNSNNNLPFQWLRKK